MYIKVNAHNGEDFIFDSNEFGMYHIWKYGSNVFGNYPYAIIGFCKGRIDEDTDVPGQDIAHFSDISKAQVALQIIFNALINSQAWMEICES